MSLAPRAVAQRVLAHLAIASVSLAGPLDPPPGPIVSTNKPLAEIEPRTAISPTNTPGDAESVFLISQPGSYYLTGNLTGVAGRHGVKITTSDVVIDLAGFALSGVAGSFDGVSAVGADLARIDVHSGNVRGWGGDGIDIGSAQTTACSARNVRSTNNALLGIRVHNAGAILDCIATHNGAIGIGAGQGAAIARCTSQSNTSHGFSVANGATIVDCAASLNTLSGFFVTNGGRITACSAYANGSHGIELSSGCTVTDCSAYQNAASGIFSMNGCAIVANSARANDGHGIRVLTDAVVLNNACADNGTEATDGAGIAVNSSDNRIEGNNCVGNRVGVNVDFRGNVIVRNTCSSNTTNWSIAANNVFGPILDRTAPASAAVNGNAAPSSLGSTDANANYTY